MVEYVLMSGRLAVEASVCFAGLLIFSVPQALCRCLTSPVSLMLSRWVLVIFWAVSVPSGI